MAYTKILVIKNERHLKAAMDYAITEDKTHVEVLTEYIADEEKTLNGLLQEQYVTGINCNPKTAAQKMVATKAAFGKQDKRQAYHIIQSFAPGEVTPELAHQIGVEYAHRFLSDYEVVIGTHLDRGHFHNHILINSVSCKTGKKFHINKQEFHEKLRGISDELCRKYGLSVIEHKDDREMSYGEYMAHRNKRGFKKQVIADVETCIGKSKSIGEFYAALENMGYLVEVKGVHPKVQPPGKTGFWRLSTLGYPSEALIARIAGQELPQSYRKPQQIYYCNRKFQRRKLTRFEALYLHYLYLLGKAGQKQSAGTVSIQEYEKFLHYKKQLIFVAENHITDMGTLHNLIAQEQQQVKTLDIERFRLTGAERKRRKLFGAHAIYERYKNMADILQGERKKEFLDACEYIELQGFKGQEQEVSDMRSRLLNAKEQNRQALLDSKKRLGRLNSIDKDTKKMRSEMEVAREQKPAQEKQQNIQDRKAPAYRER
ncbi:relaxase/mobilization nuclease domain-containing protein [Christensenellaceae bacterium OttesenSCG-928-K19]|nr:relaxase/mobilization nuclease domain-containing protein [Christensenellaceae bacterium OttesenSCG-928-K19]